MHYINAHEIKSIDNRRSHHVRMLSDTERFRLDNNKIAANKLWQNPIKTSVFIKSDKSDYTLKTLEYCWIKKALFYNCYRFISLNSRLDDWCFFSANFDFVYWENLSRFCSMSWRCYLLLYPLNCLFQFFLLEFLQK